MRLLSTDQIRSVCITARRAYDVWEGRDDWEAGHYPLSRTGCFDAWRHRETARIADGEASLRRCISERHYLRLLAHFNDLAGQGGEALRALLRHAEEARIVIFFKLQQALAQKGLDEGYAAHIARCKFKKPLGDCTEKQLWVLFFDVRRAKARGEPRPEPARIAESLGTVSVAGRPKPATRARKAPAATPALSLAHLRACLDRAVQAEDYEEAARLRDLIAAQDREPAAAAGNPF